MGHCFTRPAADATPNGVVQRVVQQQQIEPAAPAPVPLAKVSSHGHQPQAAGSRGVSRNQLIGVHDSAKNDSASGGAVAPAMGPGPGMQAQEHISSGSGASGAGTSLFPAPSAASGATSTATGTSGGTSHRHGHTFSDQKTLLQPEELLSDVRLETMIGQGG